MSVILTLRLNQCIPARRAQTFNSFLRSCKAMAPLQLEVIKPSHVSPQRRSRRPQRRRLYGEVGEDHASEQTARPKRRRESMSQKNGGEKKVEVNARSPVNYLVFVSLVTISFSFFFVWVWDMKRRTRTHDQCVCVLMACLKGCRYRSRRTLRSRRGDGEKSMPRCVTTALKRECIVGIILRGGCDWSSSGTTRPIMPGRRGTFTVIHQTISSSC